MGAKPTRGAIARYHLVRWVWVAGLAALALFVFPSGVTNLARLLTIGVRADRQVVAPFDFVVTKTDEELRREADAVAASVRPIYDFRAEAYDSAQSWARGFFASLDSVAKRGREAVLLAAQRAGVPLTGAEADYLVRGSKRNAMERALGDLLDTTDLSIDQVLQRIAEYAKDLLRAETSAVYMLDEDDNRLHGIAVLGNDTEEIKNDPLVLGSGIAGQIALSKVGEIVNYAAADPRAITIKGTENNPVEHIMGVPVLAKDQLTGLVVVWRTGSENQFKPSELNFLSSLAQQQQQAPPQQQPAAAPAKRFTIASRVSSDRA